MSPEQRDVITNELKKLGASLNLSEEQKQKLQGFMSEASEKLQQFRHQNPSASKEELIKKAADHRAMLRQRLVHFLSPEQLTNWDEEMAKAREFLGQKLAA